MKKITYISLLALVSILYTNLALSQEQVARMFFVVGGGVAAAASCSVPLLFAECTEHDDGWGPPDTKGQKIKNSASISICQAKLYVTSADALTTGVVKICTDQDCATGCSANVSDTVNIGIVTDTEITFTFATPPTATTDFWLCLNLPMGGGSWRSANRTDCYEGTDYDAYRGDTELADDFAFKLYKAQ